MKTNVTNKSSSTITIAMITVWLLGSGSGERRGRGHRSLPVPGARLQRGRCLPVTHAPTPGQPAVTPHCRDEWQMVLSLEGRRTGSGPPAGLCEAVRADGLRWSPCHALPELMVCAVAWSRPSPFLGRDEGVSAKLSEDKEDPGHLGPQKQDSRGP